MGPRAQPRGSRWNITQVRRAGNRDSGAPGESSATSRTPRRPRRPRAPRSTPDNPGLGRGELATCVHHLRWLATPPLESTLFTAYSLKER
ncbi:hypothetical protein NDU88_001343 [Pleurodeles waltl]|uniref:Uncharacterized protein n=1 Tax=Pleurodeles waltl TaxID=8319 RepID=A0AAV7KSL2_PLEWA|nr:hypothetical protein NDU88_001343 [Pleurodeles waltl]